MNILIAAPFFYPSMGGIETVTDTLAAAFSSLGHQVTVVTPTKNNINTPELQRSYQVIREPSSLKLLKAVKACDVFIHNSISLKNLWPLFIYRRKWVTVHHGPLFTHSLKLKVIAKLKLFATSFACNVGVSAFIGKQFAKEYNVIHNPIKLDDYKSNKYIIKDKDFVFVGRLIRAKGAHLYVEALVLLKNFYPNFTATIIGSGEELENLKKQVEVSGLKENVLFTGRLDGKELLDEVSRHTNLVVPSIWKEPFGVVVLEGLACGCNIIASDIGGLPEAVGVCGTLVNPNDFYNLCLAMRNSFDVKFEEKAVNAHLQKYESTIIAKQYISLFSTL